MIISGRNFYQIHAHQVNTAQPAKNFQRLHGGEATTYRSASAGRVGGVQTVDIKGQVHRVVAHPLADRFDDRLAATLVYLPRIQHSKALVIIIGSTQTDLHRACRINQPLAGSVPEHSAVVDAPATFLARPGVTVSIEVDQ
ncbi:hypothetical protein D3C77_621580 [compost metagenome]